MLIVHHLGISQSDRIVWLCEELELPYELIRYDRDPVTRLAPADYKALHPAGTAPVIQDGDVLMAESGAIAQYLMTKYAPGRLEVKPESPDFPDYLYWLHYANASMMPTRMMALVSSMLPEDVQDSRIVTMMRARGTRAFDLVEQRLGSAPYFGGAAFSAADIMMLFPLTTMRVFAPQDLVAFPNIRGYLERIGERPAFRRAMEKADPGMVMLMK